MALNVKDITRFRDTYKEYLEIKKSGEYAGAQLGFNLSDPSIGISEEVSLRLVNYVKHRLGSSAVQQVVVPDSLDFRRYLKEWLNMNIELCIEGVIELMEKDYMKNIDRDIDKALETLIELKQFKAKKERNSNGDGN